jgi:hypothetical protein
MKTSYVDDIARYGFALLEDFVNPQTVELVLEALAKAKIDKVESQRAGKAFGIRNLLNVVPFTRDLANNSSCRSIVEPILGSTARVVRAIYFDKHKHANWKVSWHQDVTIAVQERLETDGYGAWSMKAGIHHVQPPASVLQNMLTLRIHLDDSEASNGALRVLPGTHRYGRLDSRQIQYWRQHRRPVTCSIRSGGAMVMKPLLLHSSMTAVNPRHRRVLHFEYSSVDLPGGLKWFEEL